MTSKQHITFLSCCCMVKKAAYYFAMSIKRWREILDGFVSNIVWV